MIPVQLDEIRTFLRDIPHINRGGCAIAALTMYIVGKRAGLDIKIFYSYLNKRPYDNNSEYIEGKGATVDSCQHAFCMIGETAFDCERTVNMDNFFYYHEVTTDLVVQSLKIGGWNSCFSREKYLPIIEKHIKKHLIS